MTGLPPIPPIQPVRQADGRYHAKVEANGKTKLVTASRYEECYLVASAWIAKQLRG